MRAWITILVAVLSVAAAAKCRPKNDNFREAKALTETFIPRRCRGLNTQVGDEYWTTIGYDGQLRDGRRVEEFLVFPADQNNGHRQRNSYIGYWITRSKYGGNRHYEAFGHVFVKPDGRVCGWFVGMNKEVVEVCGGFRVLSRSNRNPNEPIPFEWIQGSQAVERDTLGFHQHRISKFEWAPDDVFFGDARVEDKNFQGVSPGAEKFIEVQSRREFDTKVWLLRKKPERQQPPPPPQNIEKPQDPRTLLYDDPHVHSRPIDTNTWNGLYKNSWNLDGRPNSGHSVGNDPRLGQPGYDDAYQRRLAQAENSRGYIVGSGVGGDHNVFDARKRGGNEIGTGVAPASVNYDLRRNGDSNFGAEVTIQPNHPHHIKLMKIAPDAIITDTDGKRYIRRIVDNRPVYYRQMDNGSLQEVNIDQLAAMDPKVEKAIKERREEEDRRRHPVVGNSMNLKSPAGPPEYERIVRPGQQNDLVVFVKKPKKPTGQLQDDNAEGATQPEKLPPPRAEPEEQDQDTFFF